MTNSSQQKLRPRTPVPNLKKCSRAFWTILTFYFSIFGVNVYAEQVFVSILITDSYQSALYSASAFSRVADLPQALEVFHSSLTRSLSVPSLTGMSENEPLRILKIVDTEQPLNESNPATVAIITLKDNGATAREVFSSAYGSQTQQGRLTLFANPSNTNLTSRVFTAFTGRYLLTSPSQPALNWVWDNRLKLIGSSLPNLLGTFHVIVNPRRFADLIAPYSKKVDAFLNIDKLMRDFETLTFDITMDGQAISLTLRGKPTPQSQLNTLIYSLRKPHNTLWHRIPDTAFFAMLTAQGHPEMWAPYMTSTHFTFLNSLTGLASSTCFSGDRLLYLTPAKDRKAFYFAQLTPVTNAPPVSKAIKQLQTSNQPGPFRLIETNLPKENNPILERYAIAINMQTNISENTSMVTTILSLFLKQAVVETTVTNNHLITVIGPKNTLQTEFSTLDVLEKSFTLEQKLHVQERALSSDLVLGGIIRLAAFLRHIVSIMPGIKPEQMRLIFPSSDDATFGISLSPEHVVTASVRIQSSEIAALQRINRDGREVLQEIFFQMFSRQMIDLQQPNSIPVMPQTQP